MIIRALFSMGEAVADEDPFRGCNADTINVPLTVTEINVTTWVYLEGAAIDPGGQPTYILPMRTTLNELHVLPGQTYQNYFPGIVFNQQGQPYNVSPWYYNGNECDIYNSNGNPGKGAANYPSTVVDWVLVSLRDAPDGIPFCMQAALLHNDGHVEFVNGGFTCADIQSCEKYYLVIEHRNHLIVMSDTAISVIGGMITYDFRSTQSYLFDLYGFGGVGQKEIFPGVYAMYAGNGDQVITPSSDTDLNFDDRTVRDNQNGNAGRYRNGDFNLNGDCNYNDRINYEYNNGKFSTVPRN